MTLMFYSGEILWGEISCQSFLRVKGLKRSEERGKLGPGRARTQASLGFSLLSLKSHHSLPRSVLLTERLEQAALERPRGHTKGVLQIAVVIRERARLVSVQIFTG